MSSSTPAKRHSQAVMAAVDQTRPSPRRRLKGQNEDQLDPEREQQVQQLRQQLLEQQRKEREANFKPVPLSAVPTGPGTPTTTPKAIAATNRMIDGFNAIVRHAIVDRGMDPRHVAYAFAEANKKYTAEAKASGEELPWLQEEKKDDLSTEG